MSGFDSHAFCRECGSHRQRMPFGSDDEWWVRGPCRRCGAFSTVIEVVRPVGVFRRRWVTRDGRPFLGGPREGGRHA